MSVDLRLGDIIISTVPHLHKRDLNNADYHTYIIYDYTINIYDEFIIQRMELNNKCDHQIE